MLLFWCAGRHIARPAGRVVVYLCRRGTMRGFSRTVMRPQRLRTIQPYTLNRTHTSDTRLTDNSPCRRVGGVKTGAHACISTRSRLLVLQRHGFHCVGRQILHRKNSVHRQTAPSHASFSTVIMTRCVCHQESYMLGLILRWMTAELDEAPLGVRQLLLLSPFSRQLLLTRAALSCLDGGQTQAQSAKWCRR